MSMRGRTRHLLRVHEREITSSAIALLFAVALCLFVLGRGPGSLVWIAGGEQNLKWLPFAGAGVSWLPYNESVKWLPYQRSGVVLATPTPSPSATPEPAAEPTAPSGGSPTPPPVVPTPPPPPRPPPPPPPAPVVLFADDFSGDSLGNFVPGWRQDSPAWSILNDGGRTLNGTGTYAVIEANPQSISPPASTWSNYTVTAQVKASNSSRALVLARYQDKDFYYGCGLDMGGNLIVGRSYRGQWLTISSSPFDHSAGFYPISFTVNGNNLTCKAGTVMVTGTANYFSNGTIGAMTTSTAEYHNFTVVKVG
jgi:hypothetical protein